jgi:hypothetical protein
MRRRKAAVSGGKQFLGLAADKPALAGRSYIFITGPFDIEYIKLVADWLHTPLHRVYTYTHTANAHHRQIFFFGSSISHVQDLAPKRGETRSN